VQSIPGVELTIPFPQQICGIRFQVEKPEAWFAVAVDPDGKVVDEPVPIRKISRTHRDHQSKTTLRCHFPRFQEHDGFASPALTKVLFLHVYDWKVAPTALRKPLTKHPQTQLQLLQFVLDSLDILLIRSRQNDPETVPLPSVLQMSVQVLGWLRFLEWR
jgi:hypothetical protein